MPSTRPASPEPAPPAPAVALTPAHVATLTSLAMLSAASRRADVAATLAWSGCPHARADDERCAACPFARPPSQ
jgi:hypothetical protein